MYAMWRRLFLPLLGFSFCASCGRHEEKPSLPVYAVVAEYPERADMSSWRSWVGTLVGIESAEVVPQVSGYVQKRYFVNGQDVHKGEILFQLDARQYQDALEKAEHAAAQARANLEKAQKDESFYAPLVKNGSVSRQTYVDAVQAAKAAGAALQEAESAVALAQTNVNYCTLRSPVDGVVGFTQAKEGDYVSPNGKPMVLVNQLNPIRIYFSISQQDWLNQNGLAGPLAPGKKVAVTLANGKLYPSPALIGGVDNTVSDTTGTIRLQADIPNPDDLLRPGMFVNVKAKTGEEKNALTVPISALVSTQGKNMVVTVDKQGNPRLVPVERGIAEGARVAVRGAIDVHDPVVVEGTQQAMMAAEGRAALRVEMDTHPQRAE